MKGGKGKGKRNRKKESRSEGQRNGGKAEQIMHTAKARGARERKRGKYVWVGEGRGVRGRVRGHAVTCWDANIPNSCH